MKSTYTYDDLLQILHTLIGPDGCPWDRAQTHQSAVDSLIEEAYETQDALINGTQAEFVSELGDYLFQPLFHAMIAKKDGRFDVDDIVTALCTKLIVRHPHVFGDTKVQDLDQAIDNWHAQKRALQNDNTCHPLSKTTYLPPVLRARKVLSAAHKYYAGVVPDYLEQKLSDALVACIHAENAAQGIIDEIVQLLFVADNSK
jgi:uncharacterized protein YabN with tetrapyrrole methylase and pyrophosphatase domain